MTEILGALLIVDDDPSIRFSLGQIVRNMGYSVRTAEDGFTALQELSRSRPDILLSDLNMPRMTGFELLSVVRRRFPSIFVIGMTGGYVDCLPEGVAADTFYRKASGVAVLVELLRTGTQADRVSLQASRQRAPIWLPATFTEAKSYVSIACPECLRIFPHPVELCGTPLAANCAHCSTAIDFAVVEQFA